MASVLMASAAFAGANCATKAQAASASSSSCTAKQTAACAAKGMMAGCKVEATRLASGDLVVHYSGATPEAVSYLHAKAEGQAEKFCCGMTQKMASNENCKVDMAKVSNGVLVFVSSQKKEVVDQYEKDFAALTAMPAAATTATTVSATK
jgi:hypothetical protein